MYGNRLPGPGNLRDANPAEHGRTLPPTAHPPVTRTSTWVREASRLGGQSPRGICPLRLVPALPTHRCPCPQVSVLQSLPRYLTLTRSLSGSASPFEAAG